MSKMFSIIVPVYNVAKYMDKAIESVLLQNMRKDSYEIILIDDGSTDESGRKCDIWKEKYPDIIKVIHKKNGGLGFARNSGVAVAAGEFIIFLDSDDFWAHMDALNRFEKIIIDESPDVIVFKNCIYDEIGNTYKEPKKNINGKINLNTAIKKEYYDFSAWNKVVKKSLLQKNNIDFKKGISEDMLWSFKILLYAKKFSFLLDKSVYVYRKGRSGSLTAQKCSTYREEYLQIMDDIGNLMETKKQNKSADLYASTVYITLFRYLRNNLDLKENDSQFVRCLECNKRMLRHCANVKISIIRFMIYTIGARNTILVFRNAHR